MKRRLVMKHPVTPATSRWARRVSTLACIAGVAACSVFRLPNDNFVDVDVPVIDTWLVQSEEHYIDTVGTWLNNDLLVINTVQEKPPANSRRPWRVVLFNVRTKNISTLVNKGRFVCRDDRTRNALILTNPEVDNYSKNGNYLYVSLDDSGSLSSLSAQPAWGHYCHSDFGSDRTRIRYSLREGDGFIDEGRSGGIDLDRNAHWFRPNQPPIELNVQGKDVGIPWFVPFRNEYLLERSTRVQEGRKRVFRYMSLDGKITEEAFPEHFFQKIGSAGYMWPMKNGMLLDRSGHGSSESGLFLVRDKKIYRVFGSDGVVVRRFTPSPDGCKLAFWSHREHPYSDKNTVKIIDLCEGF